MISSEHRKRYTEERGEEEGQTNRSVRLLMVLIGYKATEADEGRSDIPLSPWPWASSSLVTFDPITPSADLRNPAAWTVHREKHHSCLQMRIDFPRLGCWKCGLKYVNNVSQEQFFSQNTQCWNELTFFVVEGSGVALYESIWREFLDANRLAILIARLKCTHTHSEEHWDSDTGHREPVHTTTALMVIAFDLHSYIHDLLASPDE